MESSYIGASPAYGIFQRQVFAGDGSTTVFNLDYTVTTPTQLLVSIDGIIQEPEYSYAVSFSNGSSTINFSEPPDLNGRIWIIYLGRQLLVPTQALSSPHIDSANSNSNFVGDGSTGTFTLTRTPSVAGDVNIMVFVDNVFQVYGTNYTVSGDSLIFNAGSIPASAAKITAIQLAESNNVIDTVLDCSITNAKLSLSYSSTSFTGNGVWADRTIDAGHTVDSILVFYNGVCLQPTTDYTVSGTTLTFTFTPLNNSNIVVRYLPI